MNTGFTLSQRRGSNDLLLDGVANRFLAMGDRVRGATQINTEMPGDGKCTMRVLVLPDGRLVPIS